MFDIGWPELLVVAVIAIVVIGPKDLPRALQTVGKWIGRARSMAREFQSGIDEMVREAELEDIKKSIDRTAKLDMKKELEDAIAPVREAGEEVERTISQARIEPDAGKSPAGKSSAGKSSEGADMGEETGPENEAGRSSEAEAAPTTPKNGSSS